MLMKNPSFISQLAMPTSEPVGKVATTPVHASCSSSVSSRSTTQSPYSKNSTTDIKLESSSSQLTPETTLECDKCQILFDSEEFLVKHQILMHRGSNQPQSSQLNASPPKNAESGSSDAFCEYCNKSFCDRYFFRKHMKKTHGITLNETANVIQCDICKKMVCSKYFLRTHKEKVHGIYEDRDKPTNEAALLPESQQPDGNSDDDDENETEPGEIT
jgi:hypothetical protein